MFLMTFLLLISHIHPLLGGESFTLCCLLLYMMVIRLSLRNCVLEMRYRK